MKWLNQLVLWTFFLLLTGFLVFWWQQGGELLRPNWLWLALPGGILWLIAYTYRRSGAVVVCDPHLQPLMVTKAYPSRGFHWLLSGLIAVIALAGPSLGKEPVPLITREIGIVIVLDLSPSMLADDLVPNRLTRARFKLTDWLRRLGDEQVGLVSFSEEAFVVSPLTRDRESIELLLPLLSPEIMPVAGSRVDRGLFIAAELLEQADITAGHGHILLVSDAQIVPEDRRIARQLAQRGYFTSVLGVGTTVGSLIPDGRGGFVRDMIGNPLLSQVNPDDFAQLAADGGGIWTMLRETDEDLQQLQFLHSVENPEFLQTDETQERPVDHGVWLLLSLLILNIGVARRGTWE